MKGHLKLYAVAAVSFLLSSYARAEPILTVYYIPFAVETYVPVTKDSIVCDAWEKWTIADKTQAADLVSFLTRGESGDFKDRFVRMLVTGSDGAYYIDHNGVALVGQVTHKLDLKRIADFKKSLSPNEISTFKDKPSEFPCPKTGTPPD
jgi:hypothetical protein